MSSIGETGPKPSIKNMILSKMKSSVRKIYWKSSRSKPKAKEVLSLKKMNLDLITETQNQEMETDRQATAMM